MINIEQEVQRKILRAPTKEYVYPGVVDTLGTLLNDGHHVIIWTNEYFENVASSRLGKLRKDLPAKEKKRLSVVTATAYEDKLASLPYLFREARSHNFSSIVIIDNTKEKLDRTAEIIRVDGIHESVPCTLVWVNSELSFQASSPYSLSEDQSLLSIPSLNDITSLDHSGNTLFLIDFNDTIIDTKKWEADFNLQNRIRDYQ